MGKKHVLQFFQYTGCGAENQQRQKDKVKLFMLNKTATDLTSFKTIQVQAAVPERVKEGAGREQGTCSQPDPSIQTLQNQSLIFYYPRT